MTAMTGFCTMASIHMNARAKGIMQWPLNIFKCSNLTFKTQCFVAFQLADPVLDVYERVRLQFSGGAEGPAAPRSNGADRRHPGLEAALRSTSKEWLNKNLAEPILECKQLIFFKLSFGMTQEFLKLYSVWIAPPSFPISRIPLKKCFNKFINMRCNLAV